MLSLRTKRCMDCLHAEERRQDGQVAKLRKMSSRDWTSASSASRPVSILARSCRSSNLTSREFNERQAAAGVVRGREEFGNVELASQVDDGDVV